MINSVAIVGYGKLGSALAKALFKIDMLSCVISSSVSDSENLKGIPFYKELYEVKSMTDIILLTVPDKVVTQKCNELLVHFGNKLKNKIIAHCSGALRIDILKHCRDIGAGTAAIHPYQTFFIADDDVFDRIGWGIECNSAYEDDIVEFIKKLKGNPIILSDATLVNKKLYHSSAVVASNFLASNIKTAIDLAAKSGIDPQIFIEPIIKTTVKNSLEHSNIDSGFPLTGPVVRGDVEIIEKHLSQMNDIGLKRSFCYMGLATVEMAFANNLIELDVKMKVEAILKNNL